jgi:hypothetical protein
MQVLPSKVPLPLRCTELSGAESVVPPRQKVADEQKETFRRTPLSNYWEVKIVNWDKLLVIGRDRDSFKALVGRKIRERRRNERQLAQHCTTKHQLQARNSCVADARSYRVARRLPVPAAAPFDWKALIPLKRFSKIRSAWLKKFRG